ncbi:hypothetical protein [Thermus sp.]
MRKSMWYGLLTSLALLLAACGGGDQPQPDLSLAGISPQNPTVVQGQSVELTLTFASQSGFQGEVSLSVTDRQTGQTPSWLTLSRTRANLNVPRGGQTQASLQVGVAANAPTGSHALRLKATYGGRTAERDLTLTVNPPPNFTTSLDPTNLTVQQGSSATTTLTLTPQNGFTGTVNLSLVGAPQGITLSPTSVNVTGTNPVTQALTVSVAGSVAPGSYNLQLRATSGSLTREADLSLTVEPLPPMSLSPTNPEVTLQAGSYGYLSGTVTLTLTLTPNSGFNGYVQLDVLGADGQPISGIRISNNSLYYSPSDGVRQYPVTLQVNTGSAYHETSQPSRFWDLGPNALQLRAQQENTAHTADFTLTVRADPPGILWQVEHGPQKALAVDAQGNVYGAMIRSGSFVGQGYCRVVAFRPNGERFVFFQFEINCNWERDDVEGIGVDAEGNIYVAFSFNSSLLRLRKYSPQGEMFWEKTISGLAGFAKPESLVVTPEGRAYVATTELVLDQNGGQIATRTAVHAFDAQGNPLWVKRFQAYLQTPEQNPRTYPVETEHLGGLAVGPDDHIYVAGTAVGNLFRTLYGPRWNTDGLSVSAWVAKLNPADGSVVWGDQFVGELPPPYSGADIPFTLAVTPDGREVYLGGASSLNHPPYTNQGHTDGLLARYDTATGQRLELRLYGGAGYNDIRSIAFSPDGSHVYLGLQRQIAALFKLSRTNLELDSALWSLWLGYPRGPWVILPHGNLLYVGNDGGESGPHGILRIIP